MSNIKVNFTFQNPHSPFKTRFMSICYTIIYVHIIHNICFWNYLSVYDQHFNGCWCAQSHPINLYLRYICLLSYDNSWLTRERQIRVESIIIFLIVVFISYWFYIIWSYNIMTNVRYIITIWIDFILIYSCTNDTIKIATKVHL